MFINLLFINSYMDFQSGGMQQDMNLDFPRLIFNSFLKLRDAKASRAVEQYLVYFDFLLLLLSPYIPQQNKQFINDDRKDFLTRLKTIRETEKNDALKINKELGLKESFCDSHLHYLSTAFGRAGLIKIQEEGEIPFDTHTFEEIKAVVRSGTMGMPSALKLAAKKKDEPNGV